MQDFLKERAVAYCEPILDQTPFWGLWLVALNLLDQVAGRLSGREIGPAKSFIADGSRAMLAPL